MKERLHRSSDMIEVTLTNQFTEKQETSYRIFLILSSLVATVVILVRIVITSLSTSHEVLLSSSILYMATISIASTVSLATYIRALIYFKNYHEEKINIAILEFQDGGKS